MQDKETVDDAEEALTCKADVTSDRQATPTDKKESFSSVSSKESSKDGKFQFRKMKTPKKEKSDKKSSTSKYEGEGILFKGKLIGLESVAEARGDKMCQDAMQKLKLGVKTAGQHKRKIHMHVSLDGIKIKDEKTGVVIYHHSVGLISFISQDITDARAFGYVFGSTTEPHQFIAIKTEKPAFHVVVALRDLFQTVLNVKRKEIENVKEQASDGTKSEKKDSSLENNNSTAEEVATATPLDEPKTNDNIYFEVLFTEPLEVPENDVLEQKEPVKTVDELLEMDKLQNEMDKLKEGINQMDSSIAAAAAFNAEIPATEIDPFDTSFVLGPKRDSISFPMPTPIPVPAATSTAAMENLTLTDNGDRYAAFNAIDASPSIFEISDISPEEHAVTDLKELEEEIARKTVPPPKPPRISKSASPDLSVFADLDPLGKDRPYKDKTEFFQDVKNPPKKVLNDLVDPSKEASRNFDINALSHSVPFPVDFESMSSPTFVNSPPRSVLNTQNAPLPYAVNGNGSPFDSHAVNNNYSNSVNVQARTSNGKTHPSKSITGSSTQPLTVNCNLANLNNSHMHENTISSPIPIPLVKDRSFSNGSVGSPYSKSPQTFGTESPNNSDYYICNYNSEGSSPTGMRNGLGAQGHYINGDGVYANGNNLTKQNVNSFLNSSANSQNGVSRPRPRPSLNKGGSVPNGGRTVSSHSLSSDSSSDYEVISRENMQSIANVLLTNGHRLRAQSLCLETNSEFKLKLPGEKNTIFAKKNDPFADDFFFSVPKKNGLLSSTEIPECV